MGTRTRRRTRTGTRKVNGFVGPVNVQRAVGVGVGSTRYASDRLPGPVKHWQGPEMRRVITHDEIEAELRRQGFTPRDGREALTLRSLDWAYGPDQEADNTAHPGHPSNHG